MASAKLPAGAWDSHMHVTDPDRFPLSPTAVYQPHKATLEQAHANAKRLDLPNLVFVQPSTYGHDNSCLLYGLAGVDNGKGRGVVSFDPETVTEGELREWHGKGVRGVRINLKSVNRDMSTDELAELLKKYDGVLGLFKGTWVIQVYADLSVVAELGAVMRELDAKVVVDHLGSPPELKPDMSTVPGWAELLRLLEGNERFFVKVSAPYRLTKGVHDPTYKSLEPAVRDLLRARGGRGVVFASDWPHTRFERVDVAPFVSRCVEWCDGDDGLVRKLFRGNAERLWDVEAE